MNTCLRGAAPVLCMLPIANEQVTFQPPASSGYFAGASISYASIVASFVKEQLTSCTGQPESKIG